jgi:GT2 family glycosyltransferase/glycosyltransferase involved in cell wall biosynthesis
MDSKQNDLRQDISHAHTSEGAEVCEPNRPADHSQLRSQPQDIAGRPEGRVAELEIQLQQKENEIHSLQQRLSDLEVSATQARIANETLTFYLERYKRVKDRFLPRGSFRERVCRRIAHRILARPSGTVQTQPIPTPVPRAITPHSAAGRTTEAQFVIEPPPEWCGGPQQPPVVIAIPNWNRVDLLRRCIESILAKTGYARYRICVYEQGSTDGSTEYLQSLAPHVDAILGDENVGFVDANNAIIRRYPKWDVVFLNNDTEVTDGWLERLVETAYRADNIGLVGSKLVYKDGRLQEAGSQVFQDGSARAYGKYADQADPMFNQLREVDYCSAACLYAKRKVLDCVGGFDNRYSPAYYEDTDLAFAAREAGFKVLYEPHSTVIHHEYSTSGGTAFDRMEANRTKFLEKWAEPLKRQQKNFWEAVSVSQREKILVIDNIVPAQDRSSGGNRLFEFLLLLARHYHVVFAYMGAYALQEYVKPLERYGITVFYPGYAKAVNNYDLDLGAVLQHNDFKFIFFELFGMAEQYLGVVRQYSPGTPVIIDTFDVHFLRETREAITANDEGLLRKAQETKRRELAVYKQADAVLTVTADDKQALLREDPQLNISVIPNIHTFPPSIVPRDGRRDLLFVGGFSHTPNVDGMLYFCREILPLVLQQLPQTRFWVVGNAPPPEIVALASENVIVTGYALYLAPYLESALVSVAPLRFGSGMKGKIGEAMAWGIPVVTTTIGAEGMGLQDGVDALIADAPEDFARRIIQLHKNPELWDSVAQNARKRVKREWSPDAVDRSLTQILAGVRPDKLVIAL